MKNISEHITYNEATVSPTALRLGITNIPNEVCLANMVLVAEKCFEPLRKYYGKPLKINSFYRCTLLNQAVKGSPTSDHMKGKSIDITAGSREENKKLFDWAKENLVFCQLINEYNFSWIHISYSEGNNKNQILAIK